MRFYSKIDIGKLRASNQDDCRVSVLSGGAVLAVVCDGMGGANAGNVASEHAVKAITDYVVSSFRSEMDTVAISRMLVAAIRSANIEIYEKKLIFSSDGVPAFGEHSLGTYGRRRKSQQFWSTDC